jgi:hypothetical protein
LHHQVPSPILSAHNSAPTPNRRVVLGGMLLFLYDKMPDRSARRTFDARASRDSSRFFKVISGVTFYTGKEGVESEAGRLYVGSVLHTAVAEESRSQTSGPFELSQPWMENIILSRSTFRSEKRPGSHRRSKIPTESSLCKPLFSRSRQSEILVFNNHMFRERKRVCYRCFVYSSTRVRRILCGSLQ